MSAKSQNMWFILGATVIGLVGAVGVVIIEKIKQKKEQQAMAQSLARLDMELQVMRRELEVLRSLQKSNASKRTKKSRDRANTMSTVTTDEYVSATDADSSDLEFYDVSDEEDVGISNAVNSMDRIAEEIDAVLDTGKTEEVKSVLEKLSDMLEEFPEDGNIFWRMGKAYHRLANVTDNVDEKQDYIRRGVEACEAALKISPDIPEAHKWLAILVGSRAEIQPLKERISDGHLFKKHLDLALELNPEDYILHHMLGRFAYEVASLKWYERKAASAFFAEPPTATFQEALDHFLEVEKQCERQWKENKLFVAKCYIAMGRIRPEGVEWLKKAESIENQDESDRKIHEEAKSLLEKYKNSR